MAGPMAACANHPSDHTTGRVLFPGVETPTAHELPELDARQRRSAGGL